MTGSDDKLRVALIGANASGSGWGPVAHMPAIAAVEQLDLVALCTSSSTSAAAAADAYGIARLEWLPRWLPRCPKTNEPLAQAATASL